MLFDLLHYLGPASVQVTIITLHARYVVKPGYCFSCFCQFVCVHMFACVCPCKNWKTADQTSIY